MNKHELIRQRSSELIAAGGWRPSDVVSLVYPTHTVYNYSMKTKEQKKQESLKYM